MAVYKQLSSILHEGSCLQQSASAVDLVVPYPLQQKQAAALRCIALAHSVPVRVVDQQPEYESDGSTIV